MSTFSSGVILIVIGVIVNIAGIVAEWEIVRLLGRNIMVVPLSGFALGALIVGCALWILGTFLVITAYDEKKESERCAEQQANTANSQISQLQSVGITISGNRVTISGGDAANIATREANYLLDLRRDGLNEVADKIISGQKDQQLEATLSTYIERLGLHSPYRDAYIWAVGRLKADPGTLSE